MERLRLVLAAVATAALVAVAVLLILIRGDLERLGDQVTHAGEAGERARLRDFAGDRRRDGREPEAVGNEAAAEARAFVNEIVAGDYR